MCLFVAMDRYYIVPQLAIARDVCDCVGFVVSDSFGYCHGPGGWRVYFSELVDYFFEFGVLLYVAVMDGACVMADDFLDLFRGLSDRYDCVPDFVVLVSMGNDLLTEVTYPLRLRRDRRHLSRVSAALCRLPLLYPEAPWCLFYGGSSALFGYVRDAERYDAAVAEVIAGVRHEYDYVDNLDGLAPLVTMDGIGHVHESDADRVLRYLRRAIDQGVGLGLFRRRPVWRRFADRFCLA